MQEHPVKLVVTDALTRQRLTVLSRLILAIPLVIVLLVRAVGVMLTLPVAWLVALASGSIPAVLHEFYGRTIRYSTQVNAYLGLVGGRYPGFSPDAYEIDVVLPERERLSRLRVLFRLPLALPALALYCAVGGGLALGSTGADSRATAASTGLFSVVMVCGWFASLALGRLPRGLRDAGAFSLGYSAMVGAYCLLLTDRYPCADPTSLLERVERPPLHPVHIVGDADAYRRSRLTVLLRVLLAFPHFIWLLLWTVVAFPTVLLQWFVLLVSGSPAAPLHRFIARYVRYGFHVQAFVYLAANPFPGFAGEPGYPLDLVLPAPGRQHRLTTIFRGVLAIPAFTISAGLGTVLGVAAMLSWFAALGTGRSPAGLRNVSAYALRYQGQVSAYVLLLTDVYPNASPLEGAVAG